MATPAFDSFESYQQKKQRLIEEIKQKSQQSENITLNKPTSNLFRHRQPHQNKIDVRAFNQVISIDKEKLLAEVEGMATYEDLVTETLKHGFLPTVVPELKTITIGGALSGIGVESSSFRYGLVHETITQFDALLPDGRVLDCRPDNEYSDLFYAFPNSYGTLGYALKVTVRLIAVKTFVKLNYLHFSSANEFFQRLNEVCLANRTEGEIAFVDGVIFSDNHYVLITGEMVDFAPFTSNYRYLKMYYRAVKNKTKDYLSMADYIWRWDTDWFWCSKVFYLQNPVLRFLMGKWLLNSKFYTKMMRFVKRNIFTQWLSHCFEKPNESVIQDVAIPINRALEYLNFFQREIKITPTWICPIYPLNSAITYPFFKMQPNQLYVNFGFWDMIPSEKPAGYYNRLVEAKVAELGGNKSLYASSYYTEEEFWKIYNKSYYNALKNKYDPLGRLNSLYQKCVEKI